MTSGKVIEGGSWSVLKHNYDGLYRYRRCDLTKNHILVREERVYGKSILAKGEKGEGGKLKLLLRLPFPSAVGR
jgi:hypothetical protein